MNKPDPEYSIVVPVFNSSNSLVLLAEQINMLFNEELKKTYELILVDDGSANSETWKTINSLTEKFSNIQGIRLTRNFGQQAATLCGMKYSRGQYIITMDDDLQHPPSEVKKLIRHQDHDVVIGIYRSRKHSVSRRINSSIKDYSERLILRKPSNLKFSSFRLIKRSIVDHINERYIPEPYFPSILLYATKDIVNIEVVHQERHEGKSGYSIFKLFRLYLRLFITQSSAVLRFTAGAGIFISMVSFGIMIYFILKKFFYGIPVPGWTSLITILCGIGGLILLSVSILGEYILRIVNGIEKKPLYIIAEKK